MIELYQLMQLVSIEKYGTLSKAAEALHLSQPALTRSMQKLENELQVSLFHRQKNKIEFNSNGKMALEYARKILDQIQAMTKEIRHFDRTQHTIFIGSCAPAPLWEILPTLSDLYPDMTISTEIKECEMLIRGLKDGTYQMIILPYSVDLEGVSCIEFQKEHLFFLFAQSPPSFWENGASSERFERGNDAAAFQNRILEPPSSGKNAGYTFSGSGRKFCF